MTLAAPEIDRAPAPPEHESPRLSHAPAPSRPAVPRLDWVDVGKGICAISMVFGHVVGGLLAADVLGPVKSWSAFYDWKSGFNMPVLFVLCGLFLTRSLNKGFGRFVKSRVRTLLYPHMVWTTIYWLILLVMHPYANSRYDLTFPYRMFYDPGAGMWTLATLFVCGVLFAALSLIGLRVWSIVAVAGGGFLITSWLTAVDEVVTGGTLGTFIDRVRHISWYGFWLALGAALSRTLIELERRWNPLLLALACAAGVGASVAAFGYLEASVLRRVLHAAAGVVGTLALAGWIARVWPGVLSSVLQTLGRRALEIYMLSAIGMVVPRLLLMKVLNTSDPWILLGVCTAGGVIFPLVVVSILDALGVGYIFRFEPVARTRFRATKRQTAP